ncbi:S26 family signal peptidase [Mesorhizobium sp.]|uniref:S26 family signal peptidase n=1 Tax=Mesorhizobium sp. TaxID=1871066 RepID=UPI000FEA8546|nr:S26 family signal peptidase [Mesorhizobium sp.]RWM32008.1 MAG: S26 family signal peptidase [Mesorhizobium sp.]RWM40246.1 MAG: S26 family signal peptidase [Mesorhizobium sp.]TIO77129.1 MAG: S26 family signal peptidase [Mesorhizobium sp.]TIO84104.1 MAG: S26 family signal peptidase [Mesorhizobium sp.]TJV53531.1 MAG: S26 family signal peptidase [Mesorhizobium sp.]
MMRSAILLVMALATMGALCPVLKPVPPKFVWNASASAAIGLYRIDARGPFGADDLVAVEPPATLKTFLADRGYLPKGVLLLKHILAVSAQTVCRNKFTISVDGRDVGVALERDRAGRELPGWQGCRPIPVDAVFLMNRQVRDSFDGRYFGLISTDHIIGRAVPLWTDEQGDGRFQWGASAR